MKYIQDSRTLTYGSYTVETIGHLMLWPQGTISHEKEEYTKLLIGGVVVTANLELGKHWELWTSGIVFQSSYRRTGNTYKNKRIDEILTRCWTKTPNWPKKKEVKNIQGLARLIVAEHEKVKIKGFSNKTRKYMIAGSIIGKSLHEITEDELWSGRTILLPQVRYNWANAPDEKIREGMNYRRIDQWLCSDALTNEKLWGNPVENYQQKIPTQWLLDSTPIEERKPSYIEFMKQIGW